MTDPTPARPPVPAKTRKATLWQAGAVPGFDDLRAGGERRKAFLSYWTGATGRKEIAYYGLHKLFRLLSPRRASAAGGALALRLYRAGKLEKDARIVKRNLAIIRPEWSPAEIEAAAEAHFEHVGRLMAEFSQLDRLMPAGLIEAENAELLQRVRDSGPTILVCCHTGNWEVATPLLTSLGFRWAAVVAPPTSPVQREIARRLRESFGGVTLLPAGLAGARPTVRWLQQGGMISMFCDEGIKGRAMAPFFGRKPHLDGNLAVAARFARMTGAKIVVGHSIRLGGCRFKLTCKGPIDLPSASDPQATLLDDVTALNAALEPIVREYASQWYFLTSRVDK